MAASPVRATNQIDDPADVARALSVVRDRAARKATTQEMHRPLGTASNLAELRSTTLLPVAQAVSTLLPSASLRRGSVIQVTGSPLLLIALIAEASRRGAWIAIIGWPDLNPAAIAEAGALLEHVALVPYPATKLLDVAASLIDGMDIVVLKLPGDGITDKDARVLAARARRRSCAFIPFGQFPQADMTLTVTKRRWHGLGSGHGRLRYEDVTVVARGRGSADRPCTAQIRLPLAAGQATTDVRLPAEGGHLRAIR